MIVENSVKVMKEARERHISQKDVERLLESLFHSEKNKQEILHSDHALVDKDVDNEEIKVCIVD